MMRATARARALRAVAVPPLLTDKGLPSTVLGTLPECLLFAVGDAVGAGVATCAAGCSTT